MLVESHRVRTRLLYATACLCAAAVVFALGACSAAGGEASDDAAQQADVGADALSASEVKDTARAGAWLAEAKQGIHTLLDPYGTDVAFSLVSLDDESVRFSINGDEQIPSASMIKLLILAEFLSQVDEGTISLESTHELTADDIAAESMAYGSGSIGTSVTYEDLARQMIAVSDNTSANVLMDILGMENINKRASELGLKGTVLNRKMLAANIIHDTEHDNYTTANDVAIIFQGIQDETIASPAMCEKAKQWLLEQEDNTALAAGLPSSALFAHKTGSLSTVRHDGGIIFGNAAPCVVVMLTQIGSENLATEEDANSLMAKVAAEFYQ